MLVLRRGGEREKKFFENFFQGNEEKTLGKKINSYFFPSTHLVHADPDQLVAPGVHHVAPPVGVVENGQVGPVRVPRRLADAAGDPGHGSGVHDPDRLQLTAGVPPRVTQRPLAEVEKKDKNFLRGGAHFFPKKRGGRKKTLTSNGLPEI